MRAAEQTVEEYQENEERHCHIGAITLECKGKQRKQDPCHRSGYQKEQTKLYDTSASKIECPPHNARNVTKLCGYTVEDTVFGICMRVLAEIDYTSRENNHGSKKHTSPQQSPDDLLHPFVRHT